MAFEQGGIFIVPYLMWQGASVFAASVEGPPRLVLLYDKQLLLRTHYYSDPHVMCLDVYQLYLAVIPIVFWDEDIWIIIFLLRAESITVTVLWNRMEKMER